MNPADAGKKAPQKTPVQKPQANEQEKNVSANNQNVGENPAPTVVQALEVQTDEAPVSRSEFNALMSRLNELQNGKEQWVISTQRKMYSWPRKYRFKLIDGKPVCHLFMKVNLVRKNENGGWTDKQIIEVTYPDGKKEEMQYFDYQQQYEYCNDAGFVPKEIENKVHVTFRDGTEQTMDSAEFERYYKVRVEDAPDKVINYDEVAKADNIDYYTFQEAGFNNGEPFIVDFTAIN